MKRSSRTFTRILNHDVHRRPFIAARRGNGPAKRKYARFWHGKIFVPNSMADEFKHHELSGPEILADLDWHSCV
jgi:hypothetical protein